MSLGDRVLIAFDLPDADPFPAGLVEALATTEVVALGHYGLPEQTPPGAAREQFEADAHEELADLVRPFENAGVAVRTQLVFSSDRQKAIDRVARTEGCDAILTTGKVETIDRLSVVLGGKPEFDRVLSFVADLVAATGASVTLCHGSEETLTNATERLVEESVDPGRIYQRLARNADLEDDCDLHVIGEPASSRGQRVLRTVSSETAFDTDDPALIIRSPDRS